MEHRGRQLLEWTQGSLKLKVRSTGKSIEADITRDGKILYYQKGFATWAGAVNAVSSAVRSLDPK